MLLVRVFGHVHVDVDSVEEVLAVTETITIARAGTRETSKGPVYWIIDEYGREFMSFRAEVMEGLLDRIGQTVDITYDRRVRKHNDRSFENLIVQSWTPAASAAGSQAAAQPHQVQSQHEARDIAIMRQTACKCACEIFSGAKTVDVLPQVKEITDTLYRFMISGEWQ